MDNVKEFHLYLDVSYPNDNTLHSFEAVKTFIENGKTIIHTTQVIACETSLFEKGYRVFIHPSREDVFEITLGECERTSRTIKPEHCLYKLILAGEFTKGE